MRTHIIGTFLLLCATTPAAAATAGDPASGKFTIAEATKGIGGTGKLTAAIQTSMGTFTCELYEQEAPNTVANFVGLARGLRPFQDPKTEQWVKRNFYDGLVFHRVIPGFMIQGGDVRGDGTGTPGYEIQDEKNDPHKFDRGGVLAMANRGPNTGGSQFFITEKEQPALDDRPGAHYQIFGQCQDAALVKKIAAVARDGRDRPNQDVKIVKVTISRKAGGGGKKPADKGEKPAGDKAEKK